MGYSIKLGSWNSVFLVPSVVIDKHIKLVGSSQLKVLLWILRNTDKKFSEKDISKALSLHIEDVKDAINYWIETNIMKFDGENFYPGDIEKSEVQENAEVNIENNVLMGNSTQESFKERPRPISRSMKLDREYITERIKSSKEVSFLMQEAQVILGRPISNGDSSILLTLHDNDGLPIDVILMLMQYAVSVGKGSMKYIETVGISWGKEEIDTVEKAEAKIKRLSKIGKSWKDFEKIIGIEHRSPTSREEEAINRWYNIWNYSAEMIKEAYEICVNSNGKYVLRYMDSIISRWEKSKIFSVDQVKSDRKGYNDKNSKKVHKPSYDVDEYEKYNIYDEIG